MKIAVIGSTNIDRVVEVSQLPEKGETVTASSYTEVLGGKGCNQAVALARLGADVVFFTALKDDKQGREIQVKLQQYGVNVEHIKLVTDSATGTALITVGPTDNTIVVVEGANATIDTSYIQSKHSILNEVDIIVLQNEIPIKTISYIIDTYHECTTIIYNPAPYKKLAEQYYLRCDYIIPNETEYDALKEDLTITSIIDKLVITKGAEGAEIASIKTIVPAFPSNVVDPTGAGDAFVAGFTYSLSQGTSIKDAVLFANAVAALSTEQLGAQASVPTLEQVHIKIQKNQTDQ